MEPALAPAEMTASFPSSVNGQLSVNGFVWEVLPCDERLALALSQKFTLPEVVGRMLALRGVSLAEAEDFLNPSLKNQLPDPFHLKDMRKAAERVARAVKSGERVVIFGDYDVDGATSSALLCRFLAAAGNAPRIYIPDRIGEGYGPNENALLRLRNEGASLVITVDCGAVAYAPLSAAAKVGLEAVVIDHHLGAEQLPEAVAVVNPNRLDETTEYRYLCAAGVSFLLAVAVNRLLRESGWYAGGRVEPDLFALLDLVALGTVCDVMPLTGFNRTLVAQGLKVMAQRRNIGLRTLADSAGMEGPPSVYHAGFMLGPRINVGGRIGKSDLGARLLTTENVTEAEQIAEELEKLNRERQAIEVLVLEEAIAQAEAAGTDTPLIIVSGAHWHPGVSGIIAGRLKERFRKPAAVIALQDGVGKASARSVAGVDLGAAVTDARLAGLLVAGGGHAMAAGFTVAEARIPELGDFLRAHLEKAVARHASARNLPCDLVLQPSAITLELARTLERIGHYGNGHPEPRIVLERVRILQVMPMGEKHFRCVIGEGGIAGNRSVKLRAPAFRAAGTPLGDALQIAAREPGCEAHLLGRLRLSHWQGREQAEFSIEDMARV